MVGLVDTASYDGTAGKVAMAGKLPWVVMLAAGKGDQQKEANSMSDPPCILRVVNLFR